MRRPWIKIEVSTPDKPEICAIATQLRIDPDAVVGKLVRFWSWAELSGADPNDLNVTKEFINKVCGRKGFAEALIQAGWLNESDGRLSFPNFERHNGNASKVRGLTARRVEQHRARKGKENVKNVTKRTPKGPKSQSEAAPEEPVFDSANSVLNQPKPLASVDVVEEIRVESANVNAAPEALEVRDEAPVEITIVEVEPEPSAEATEVTEEKPKKRRTKAASVDEAQPMLF
jgi:DNA replication protein DnaT